MKRNKNLIISILFGLISISVHAGCAVDSTKAASEESHALLYEWLPVANQSAGDFTTTGSEQFTAAGLLINKTAEVVRLNKFYAIAERKVQYVVRFSADARAMFSSSEKDFNATIDLAKKRISIATTPVTETSANFLRANHDFLVEVYHVYQLSKVRVVDMQSGEAAEIVAVHDGQGGVGKGILQPGFSVGMQWDHYCFGLSAGSSMLIKRISVYALKKDVQLLLYGDSITQPEGYFPTKDFSMAWTQQVIRKLKGNAMSSGRGGATIEMVLEYIKNELPFIRSKYVMVTIGTNGGNTEQKLLQLVEYIKSQGAIPILNNIPSNESGTQVTENLLIEKVRTIAGLKGCLFDLATSVAGDGKLVDKSTMYWEDYTGSYGWQIYHHPNEVGGSKMFARTLLDVPEIYQ
ncbi:MAG: SGNH/GDSL hydrolase family protein [Chitinophagaceae bacterium]|nr:MAG: SGNH/GDSL hydrolase family protein [Chitinophagaceae bacterium]